MLKSRKTNSSNKEFPLFFDAKDRHTVHLQQKHQRSCRAKADRSYLLDYK